MEGRSRDRPMVRPRSHQQVCFIPSMEGRSRDRPMPNHPNQPNHPSMEGRSRDRPMFWAAVLEAAQVPPSMEGRSRDRPMGGGLTSAAAAS